MMHPLSAVRARPYYWAPRFRPLSSSSATATAAAQQEQAVHQNRTAAKCPAVRTPPSPKLPPGLAGKLLGHAGYLFTKDDRGLDPRTAPFHRLFDRRADWYKETGSKTLLINLAGNKMICCSDPEIYKEVLSTKQGYFTNALAFRRAFGYLFPRSMIVLEGPDWQRVRRVSQKALNRMNMDRVITAVIEVVDTAVQHKALGEGNDVSVYNILSLMTFDIFHKVMYSLDPRAVTSDPKNPHVKLIKSCDRLLIGIRYRTLSAGVAEWLWSLPTKSNLEVNSARDHILSIGKAVANERKQALRGEVQSKDGTSQSLLDGLLLSQDEELLSDEEVLDQIATFFFGAFETTSNTLMFTLDGLAHNQDAQNKLRAALKKAFSNGKEDLAKATLAELDAIPFLIWTVDEAFRLNSTASFFVRDCVKDVDVGGYEVKAGTAFMVDHRAASRDPLLWHGQTDLDQFNPERFARYPMERLYSLPFGFGPRICPGRRIAIAETKTLIAHLVLEYEILPPTDPTKRLVQDSKLGLTCVDDTGYMRFKKIET